MCSAWAARRAEEDLSAPGEGKENPSRLRQLLKEMISSWLGVTGVRAEEMTKSRKI